MKKQKTYTATEVAKLLNQQADLANIKESNIEHVAKKKPVKLKKAPKPVAKVAKKKVKAVSQKRLFGLEDIIIQPKKMPIKKEVILKMPMAPKIVQPPKKEELPKKRSKGFLSKLLNGFKKNENR